MNEIDLSTEALLARRAQAEAATPGPWGYFYCDGVCIGPQKRNDIFFETPQELSTELSRQEQEVLAAHIVANDPQTVMAHVNEILRLRAEVERLNKEADYLAGVIAAAYCAQENVTHCEKTEGLPLHKLRDACAACWREAARKALEYA